MWVRFNFLPKLLLPNFLGGTAGTWMYFVHCLPFSRSFVDMALWSSKGLTSKHLHYNLYLLNHWLCTKTKASCRHACNAYESHVAFLTWCGIPKPVIRIYFVFELALRFEPLPFICQWSNTVLHTPLDGYNWSAIASDRFWLSSALSVSHSTCCFFP